MLGAARETPSHPGSEQPPRSSTRPSGSLVAVCTARGMVADRTVNAELGEGGVATGVTGVGGSAGVHAETTLHRTKQPMIQTERLKGFRVPTTCEVSPSGSGRRR